MAHRRVRKDRERVERGERHRSETRIGRVRLAGILAVTVVALVVVAAVSLTQSSAPDGGPGIGVTPGLIAPDFTITDIDGSPFRLYAHRGQPVLIDFMGSFCSACVVQMRSLVPVYRELGPRGLIVLSIDVGGSLGTENPEDARNFMVDNGGTWPIALDDQGLGLTYRVTSPTYVLPKTFILAPNGAIAVADTGILGEEQLRTIIEPML